MKMPWKIMTSSKACSRKLSKSSASTTLRPRVGVCRPYRHFGCTSIRKHQRIDGIDLIKLAAFTPKSSCLLFAYRLPAAQSQSWTDNLFPHIRTETCLNAVQRPKTKQDGKPCTSKSYNEAPPRSTYLNLLSTACQCPDVCPEITSPIFKV
jgi:hypothetical protein